MVAIVSVRETMSYTIICTDGTILQDDIPAFVDRSELLDGMRKYDEETNNLTIALSVGKEGWKTFQRLLDSGTMPRSLEELEILWELFDYFQIDPMSILENIFPQHHLGIGQRLEPSTMFPGSGLEEPLFSGLLFEVCGYEYVYLRSFYHDLFARIEEKDVSTIRKVYCDIREKAYPHSSAIIGDFLVRLEMLKARLGQDVDFQRFYTLCDTELTHRFKVNLAENAAPWKWAHHLEELPSGVYLAGGAILNGLKAVNTVETEAPNELWSIESDLDFWIVEKDPLKVWSTYQEAVRFFTKDERVAIMADSNTTTIYGPGRALQILTPDFSSVYEAVQHFDVPFTRALFNPRRSELWVSDHTRMVITSNQAVFERVKPERLRKYLEAEYEYVNGDVRLFVDDIIKQHVLHYAPREAAERSDQLTVALRMFQSKEFRTDIRIHPAMTEKEVMKWLGKKEYQAMWRKKKDGFLWYGRVMRFPNGEYGCAPKSNNILLSANAEKFLENIIDADPPETNNYSFDIGSDMNNSIRWLTVFDFFDDTQGDPSFITGMKLQALKNVRPAKESGEMETRFVFPSKITLITRNGRPSEHIFQSFGWRTGEKSTLHVPQHTLSQTSMNYLNEFSNILRTIRLGSSEKTLFDRLLLSKLLFFTERYGCTVLADMDYLNGNKYAEIDLNNEETSSGPIESAITIFGWEENNYGYCARYSSLDKWYFENIDWMV